MRSKGVVRRDPQPSEDAGHQKSFDFHTYILRSRSPHSPLRSNVSIPRNPAACRGGSSFAPRNRWAEEPVVCVAASWYVPSPSRAPCCRQPNPHPSSWWLWMAAHQPRRERGCFQTLRMRRRRTRALLCLRSEVASRSRVDWPSGLAEWPIFFDPVSV